MKWSEGLMSLSNTPDLQPIPQHYGRLVSDSLPCPGVTLHQFLQQAQGQPRYYWESSRDVVAFAGSGTAIELVVWGEKRFETIHDRAKELFADAVNFNPAEPLAAPRLFGGFAFREDFVPDNTWWNFTPAHFVLPHYQLLSVHGETWLTINANLPFDEKPSSIKAELRKALQTKIAELQAGTAWKAPASRPQPVHVDYPMSFDTWREKILNATGRMKRGELNKLVLSRVAEVRFDRRVDVLGALGYLAGAYPETYRFLFEPRPFHAFYGATPELLVEVRGSEVETMALAGSIQRGANSEADDANAQALLASEKDRYEQQLVVDEIRRRLLPLTSDLHIGDTGIMRLSNIQHIHTPFCGRLKGRPGVVSLVQALHPTPALGGDPRELAMTLIREMEPVPRGWYAAPVGWIDQNMDGQFAVAIRSAVAQDARVWMYAGAGIVAASDPQKEWDETALKFRPMLDALGIRDAGELR
jgi:menaquinone-specific isochorismate synthase